jgi:hypothetical protein
LITNPEFAFHTPTNCGPIELCCGVLLDRDGGNKLLLLAGELLLLLTTVLRVVPVLLCLPVTGEDCVIITCGWF